MQFTDSDIFGRMLFAATEGGIFAAGVGVQILFCMFAKSMPVKLIPTILGKVVIAIMAMAGGGFIAAAFGLSDWDALGSLLLGIAILAISMYPAAFYIGTAVGWIIYMFIGSQGRKREY